MDNAMIGSFNAMQNNQAYTASMARAAQEAAAKAAKTPVYVPYSDGGALATGIIDVMQTTRNIDADMGVLHDFNKNELAPMVRQTVPKMAEQTDKVSAAVPQMAEGIKKVVAYVEKDKKQLEERIDQQAQVIESLERQLKAMGATPQRGKAR